MGIATESSETTGGKLDNPGTFDIARILIYRDWIWI